MQLMRRRLHVDIGKIIYHETKISVDGKAEVVGCLFTLAYNLQCQAKSSDWLLRQLEDENSAVIQVFPVMKTLQQFIQVSNVHFVNAINECKALKSYAIISKWSIMNRVTVIHFSVKPTKIPLMPDDLSSCLFTFNLIVIIERKALLIPIISNSQPP